MSCGKLREMDVKPEGSSTIIAQPACQVKHSCDKARLRRAGVLIEPRPASTFAIMRP